LLNRGDAFLEEEVHRSLDRDPDEPAGVRGAVRAEPLGLARPQRLEVLAWQARREARHTLKAGRGREARLSGDAGEASVRIAPCLTGFFDAKNEVDGGMD